MKNKNSRISTSTGLFVALVLALASSVSQAVTIPINVYFDASSGCPLSVDTPVLNMAAKGTNKVQWVANPNNAATKGFQIIFDPFKGQPITGNPQGNTPPIALASKLPRGVYFKYTVYNPACPEAPLDPRIRVF